MLAMKTNRPYYATKAEWAAAKARELRQEADLLPVASIHDWRGVKRRMGAVRSLTADADRFDRMARRFSERGK